MRAIITFHSIDDSGSILSCSPRCLAELLEALDRQSLPVCSLNQLLANSNRAGIALTFDDGMRSVFQNALPILRDHNVPSHLFLTTAAVGKDNQWSTQPDDAPHFDMMNWDELLALTETGMVIDSHTHDHPDLRKLAASEIRRQCEQADELINEHTGRQPQFFAWPYGYSTPQARAVIADRYQGIVTTVMRPLATDDDVYDLPRLDSFYLRHPRVINNLANWRGRAWLGFRHALRRLKGGA